MRVSATAPCSAPAPTSTGAVDIPWIVGRVTVPDPRLRLICLPQAGGSASSYASWRVTPPPDIELATVELPGRGVRSAEPLPQTLEDLADTVLEGISPEFGMPYALFGHSFGALLAYEIALRAARRGYSPPVALFVSASRAPHVPVPERIADRDDEGLLDWLAGFGGFPPELRKYPAYLRYALCAVRRDLALTESYRSPEPTPVGAPVHILGGTDDPLLGEKQLQRWRDCAGQGSTLQILPGGHDYLFTDASAALAAVTRALG